MKITIETIPHKNQRYETAGDWIFDSSGDLTIRVSDLGDWRFNALIGLHELVEVLQCKHDGVTQEAVDAFDIAFEKNRAPDNEDEPGDDPKAPYQRQHNLATGIERIMAASMGVKWEEYDGAIQAL